MRSREMRGDAATDLMFAAIHCVSRARTLKRIYDKHLHNWKAHTSRRAHMAAQAIGSGTLKTHNMLANFHLRIRCDLGIVFWGFQHDFKDVYTIYSKLVFNCKTKYSIAENTHKTRTAKLCYEHKIRIYSYLDICFGCFMLCECVLPSSTAHNIDRCYLNANLISFYPTHKQTNIPKHTDHSSRLNAAAVHSILCKSCRAHRLHNLNRIALIPKSRLKSNK